MQALNLSRGIRTALVLTALSATVAASAASLVSSFDSRVGGVDVLTETPNLSFSLDGFDSNLGTLTSVEFNFTGDVFSKVSYTNPRTTNTQSLHTVLDLGLTLTERSTGTTIINLTNQSTKNESPLAHSSSGSFTYVTSGSKNNASLPILSTNPVLLSAAVSSPKFFFDLTSFDLSNTNFQGGNGTANYDTTMRVTGTVTYNYQPVPEPTTCAALGLGALGVLRRRARKNAR